MSDTLTIFGIDYPDTEGFKAKDDLGTTHTYGEGGGGGGTMQSKSVSYTPTASAQSQTVTADSGYDGLSSVAISVAAMPTGTAGTPTATKGTVSNHSVSVTPSVTNTTGYITGSTKTGTAVSVAASELVSGTKSITANATGIDVTNYASVDVAVPSSSPNLQAKTNIAPTESSQTITADSGYDGLSSVQINAVSSTYVGSGIARKSSTDLTASGATVTAPAGYYQSAATKTIASGSATTPATTIDAQPVIDFDPDTGEMSIVLNKTQSITPTVSAGYVSSGTAGTVTVTGSDSFTLDVKGATTYYPSASDQTIAGDQWLSGSQTIKAVTTTNLTAANIKKGVTVTVGDSADADRVASVTGTYEGGSSSMNVQVWIGRAARTANSYGATDATLTVAKAGTYTVSWTAWRSSSSGTMGTNLHVNNTSGTNQQTFTNTYGQQIQLTNQHYNANDVLTIYATSGSTSRTINVSNLIIKQTA